MANPKLTAPQRRLLFRLEWQGRFGIGEKATTKALLEMGLVETSKIGCTTITPAGRALLSKGDTSNG